MAASKSFFHYSLLAALGILSLGSAPAPHALKRLVIVATNDIHGVVESEKGIGGMAELSGMVRAMRSGLQAKYGKDAGLLLLDAGDQFQGTLVSNYTEGKLVFDLMNQMGYDAVVPGNHAYDFGPKGWLKDQTTDPDSKKSKQVLRQLSRRVSFPLLSANTYNKKSLRDLNGDLVTVTGNRCGQIVPSGTPPRGINWANAERPSFLKPFTIKTVAGVRVALIGIDNQETATNTLPENVSDLCFRDEIETYLEIRESLKTKADVFVLIVHNGNRGKGTPGEGLFKLHASLTEISPPLVDAIVAGHTHSVNLITEKGVPAIQSEAFGTKFGRIELVWDSEKHQLDRTQSTGYAGIQISNHACDPAAPFCTHDAHGRPHYDSEPYSRDARAAKTIAATHDKLSPLATQILGFAESDLKTDRVKESALINLISDAMREITQSDFAFLNSGGVRALLPRGTITYDHLFKALPFGNILLKSEPVAFKKIYPLIVRSVKSCGKYGVIMPSGMTVKFTQDCTAKEGSTDPNAKVTEIRTTGGTLLFAQDQLLEPDLEFTVATIDFLASGGAGYADFQSFAFKPLGSATNNSGDGILREVLARKWSANPQAWKSTIDGRWLNESAQ